MLHKLLTLTMTELTDSKHLIRTWITGNCSCTLVIPKDFAREYGLDKPTHVVIEKTTAGLLIKKFDPQGV